MTITLFYLQLLHDSERNKVLDDYGTGDLKRGGVEEQVTTQDLRISFVSSIIRSFSITCCSEPVSLTIRT